MIKKIGKYLLSVLFPPHCPFCEKIMDYREDSVCGSCLQGLPFILEPRCTHCGKTVEKEVLLCEECKDSNHIYEEGRAVFRYEGDVSAALIRMKYHGRRDYGDMFARWIVRCLGEWIQSKKIDVIVPVPIHEKRRKKRGYNQAELIAERVADYMKLEYNKDSVIRCKNTIPQKKLSILERMKNMQKAFSVTDDGLRGKIVLIIDDIYTTGLTVDVMSLVILHAGASKVYFASVSQGV